MWNAERTTGETFILTCIDRRLLNRCVLIFKQKEKNRNSIGTRRHCIEGERFPSVDSQPDLSIVSGFFRLKKMFLALPERLPNDWTKCFRRIGDPTDAASDWLKARRHLDRVDTCAVCAGISTNSQNGTHAERWTDKATERNSRPTENCPNRSNIAFVLRPFVRRRVAAKRSFGIESIRWIQPMLVSPAWEDVHKSADVRSPNVGTSPLREWKMTEPRHSTRSIATDSRPKSVSMAPEVVLRI